MWFGDPTKFDPSIASLFYMADRKLAIPEINEKIYAGINLIMNRYTESNMAHQGSKIKNSNEREQMYFWLQNLEWNTFKIPPSNLTLVLHVSTETATKMREQREKQTNTSSDGHESNFLYLKDSEVAYLHLADIFEWPVISCVKNGLLKTKDEIHQEVFEIVKHYINP